ncbi:MAG: hypothetical protein KF768_13975, partial [Phycisphaeraceae bacterium]|nr:hypothetical protein [Phycisphaeraceae bacterium]
GERSVLLAFAFRGGAASTDPSLARANPAGWHHQDTLPVPPPSASAASDGGAVGNLLTMRFDGNANSNYTNGVGGGGAGARSMMSDRSTAGRGLADNGRTASCLGMAGKSM